MLGNFFKTYNFFSKNFHCSLPDKVSENSDNENSDNENSDNENEQDGIIQYNYKIGKMSVEFVETDEETITKFMSSGFTIEINSSDFLINYKDEFSINYKLDQKSSRFVKSGKGNVQTFDYIITLTKYIDDGVEVIQLENMEEYLNEDDNIVLKIDGNDLHITKDGRNIIDIFQLGESRVYKIFENIFSDGEIYYLLSSNVDYQQYNSLEDITNNEFNATIHYDEYNNSFKIQYQKSNDDFTGELSFYPDCKNNGILNSTISIENPIAIEISYDMVKKKAKVDVANNIYKFSITSSGSLVSKDKKFPVKKFTDYQDFVNYFIEHYDEYN
jgi:hypothetical protein